MEDDMPNCFTLTPKGEMEPARLADIDEALCAALGDKPDPVRYYEGWVDMEGFALALGKDWAWMRAEWPDRIAIIDWLDEHYTPDAFAYR